MLISPVNISEGRRLDVVNAISAAAARCCFLLDVHSDTDHNRSVITLAGESGPLIEGIVAATRAAITSINLSEHRGAHPRFGAIDVVPFVADLRSFPPGDSSQEAVSASVACALRIWTELKVPCFLYDASSPDDPVSLPALRRGAFEKRFPDFGDQTPHPTAGAVAVGARPVLVAYNVNLDSTDPGVARSIAADVRRRLTAVRTIGVSLPSKACVQVSCNLLRPLETTIRHVFEAVSETAAALGVPVLESEVAGLVPRGSFGGSSPSALRFTIQPKVLEECLEKIA